MITENRIMIPKSCLILVGYSGVGKSSLAKVIEQQLNLPVIEIGKFVVCEAFKNSSEITPLEFADQTFKAGNYLRFAKQAFEESLTHKSDVLFVGPRLPQELEFLRSEFLNSLTVGLNINQSLRQQRCFQRAENRQDSESLQKLIHRDSFEQSWGLDTTISRSDLILEADQNLQLIANTIINIWLHKTEHIYT